MKLIKYIGVVCLILKATIADCQTQNSIDTLSTLLSFQEYLNQVGKNNLEYSAKRYDVNIADAEVIAQKIMPDPSLDFEITDSYFNLGIGYTLEIGNKRGARVRLAKSRADLEKLALEYYFQQLRAEAAHHYLVAMEQMELFVMKQSSYEYMLQLSHTDSIRYQTGEISEIEARQSKLEAITLLNALFDQEALYKSALVTLNQYMGTASERLRSPQKSWYTPKGEYRLNELTAIGLDNRVELFAAHKNVEVAINQHRLVKVERNIDLGFSLGYEREKNGVLPATGSYLAGVSVPLKLSNLNKGALKAAQYGVEQAEVEQQQMELLIQTEISHAFFRFEATKQKMKQYQSELLEDAHKILDGMVYRYKRGETTIVEVLIAQRIYNEVQEQFISTKQEYSSAFIDLQRSCGIWNVE